jgi:hypothetical protein
LRLRCTRRSLAGMKVPTRMAILSIFTFLAALDEPGSAQGRTHDTRLQPTSTRIVYEAEFYAPFAPETALDMVTRTPGFMLAKIEDEEKLRRGFSGAVGNVLVDERRLAAKSQSIEDVLKRIPAREVVRIELLRGSDVAGDASAAPLLANVVRRREASGGWWQGGFELANRDTPAPNGSFAFAGRHDLREYSIGGNTYALERNLPGDRTVRDEAGRLTAVRANESPREFAEYALNGQVAQPAGAGTLTLTGQMSYSRYHHDETLLTTAPEGERIEDELIPYTESKRAAELGLVWLQSAGRWDVELGALATRRRFASHASSLHFNSAHLQDSTFRQELERNSGESIVRANFTRPLARGRLEAGIEAAVNTLDGATRVSRDLGSGPFPITVPNSNLYVRENRGEAFVSHAWPIDDRWSVDSRVAVESSRLAFSGDAEQGVSLTYVKPHAQLTRALGRHQLHARMFRDVGQLDFNDFVSAVEVADELIHGGNPGLRPQTAWAAELDADLRFANDAALSLRTFRHFLNDVVDFVPTGPIEARVDAPGNIGKGTLTGVEATMRIPLGVVLPAGALEFSGTWQDSDVRDPITGEHRAISGVFSRKLRAEVRQDVPAMKWSWGIAFAGESAITDFRLHETDMTRKSSSLDAFIETTAFARFKIRVQMLSILGAAELRERAFYEPDRNGARTQSEASRRHPGHWWILTLSGPL